MRRWGTATAVALLLAGAVGWALPWLTRDRDMAAGVPTPRALLATSPLRLKAGQSACAGAVAVDPHAGQARLTLGTVGETGPPLTFALAAPGYHAAGQVPAGYPDRSVQTVDIAPPPRAVLARACVRNDGSAPVLLAATADRTRSRSLATIDGRPTGASYWLAFYEREPHSVLGRLPVILQRMTVFRPGIVGRWLLWALVFLAGLGIPLAVVWAWRRGLAEEEALAEAADEQPEPAGEPALA